MFPAVPSDLHPTEMPILLSSPSLPTHPWPLQPWPLTQEAFCAGSTHSADFPPENHCFGRPRSEHPAEPPSDGGNPPGCLSDPQPRGPCPARRRAGAALGGTGGLTPSWRTHRKSAGRMRGPRRGCRLLPAGVGPAGGWAGAVVVEEA